MNQINQWKFNPLDSIASVEQIQHRISSLLLEIKQLRKLLPIAKEVKEVEGNFPTKIFDWDSGEELGLEFTCGCRNSLASQNIRTYGTLAENTAEDLLHIRHFGLKSLKICRQELAKRGSSLKGESRIIRNSEKKSDG
jgi:DNA-directed RNA polymerase alpha subunit